jgi:hypothetical protein
MRITRTGWTGIVMVAAGLTLFGGWILWSETRTWTPVDIPISLSKGQVRTPIFTTNLKAIYLIQIEVMKKEPVDTLTCLLGLEDTSSGKCGSARSIIDASWVLWSQGTVVARGSSAEDKSGAWMNDKIARQIGSFLSERGRQYILDVSVSEDGSSLAVANPRLRVGVHPSAYETNAFAGVRNMLVAAVLVLCGAITLIASVFRERPHVKKAVRTP